MRTRFAIALAIAGLFMTTLSADVSTTLPSANVRAHNEKVYGTLSDLMATTVQPIPVIVVLKGTATNGAANRLQALASGFPVRYVYNVIPGFAATLTSGQIAALARDATVQRIEYDDEVHACLGTAQAWFGTAKARADFGVDGDGDGNPAAYTTDDIVITILDSGIDTLHMDLNGGKVIGWKDFVNDSLKPYDDNYHGTHCASIAAGSGDANPEYKGVAPGAALVGVKVLNSCGNGTTSDVLAGIDWVVANKDVYNIRVLSISLANSRCSDGKDAVSLACNNAVDAGIVVCVCAGNGGPTTKSICSPAAAEKPITVGAMSDCGENGYYLADFSSRGPTKDNRVKPDVCAPGINIMAASKGTTSGYRSLSGTSMSTPFVAGTAALMLDADPTLTPADIKSDLMSTAQDWGLSGTEIDYGSGRLQGYDAVKEAGNYTGDGPVVPPHVYVYDALSRKGKTDIWEVDVNALSYPIAVTMIMPNWKSGSSPDFDLYLYYPPNMSDTLARGITNQREDHFGYMPTATGKYQIWVTSYAGSGDYFFDLSCANASSLTKIQDQFGPGPQGEPASLAGSRAPLVVQPAEFRNGDLRLAFELAQAGPVRMAVYDGAGRTVAVSTTTARSGRNEMAVGMPRVAGGVYFYRLEAGSASATDKFAVIR
jgi:serine protease AprX